MIIKKKLKELEINPDNPREISGVNFEGLKGSLERWGMLEVYIWNKQTDRLLHGNQRLKIQKASDDPETEVDVRQVDLSPEDEQELLVEMNNLSTMGKFTKDVVPILDRILKWNPELYDTLGLRNIKKEFEDIIIDPDRGLIPPELDIRPYEHYDHILILFENQFDFMKAVELLKIGKVSVPIGKKYKIGLGRAIKGERLLKILDENYNTKQKKTGKS